MSRPRSLPAMRAVRSWLGRALVLAAIWTVVSGGSPRSWLFGLPAVLLASTLDWPGPASGVRWWRLDLWARFAAYYAGHALMGGVDVALRALTPGRSVDPGFVTVPLRLPPGPPRALLAVTISMLPGTVAASTVGNQLVVQRIHSRIDPRQGCRAAESYIAPLFGLELEATADRTGASRA